MEDQFRPTLDSIYDPGLLSISEIFHENTKMKRLPLWNSTFRHVAAIGDDLLKEMLTHGFKFYRAAEQQIHLNSDSQPFALSLEDSLLSRRSIRDYSGESITLRELSKVLSLSCGITSQHKIDDERMLDQRAYPSAGALYPLEIYPAIFNVDQITKGLYHYNVKENKIELLLDGDIKNKITDSVMYPEIIANSSLVLLVTAIFPRTMAKYGERGYRFVLLEAGHLSQNIYLTTAALGLGCVAIGGFIDDELNELMEIDGVNEAVIYVIAIGRLKKTH